VHLCGSSHRDLRSPEGDAGRFNQRPLTAAELRTLSEYLWLFTSYNNFGHAVLKSNGATNATALTHTLIIGEPGTKTIWIGYTNLLALHHRYRPSDSIAMKMCIRLNAALTRPRLRRSLNVLSDVLSWRREADCQRLR
jgi:hypothetical protein